MIGAGNASPVAVVSKCSVGPRSKEVGRVFNGGFEREKNVRFRGGVDERNNEERENEEDE